MKIKLHTIDNIIFDSKPKLHKSRKHQFTSAANSNNKKNNMGKRKGGQPTCWEQEMTPYIPKRG